MCQYRLFSDNGRKTATPTERWNSFREFASVSVDINHVLSSGGRWAERSPHQLRIKWALDTPHPHPPIVAFWYRCNLTRQCLVGYAIERCKDLVKDGRLGRFVWWVTKALALSPSSATSFMVSACACAGTITEGARPLLTATCRIQSWSWPFSWITVTGDQYGEDEKLPEHSGELLPLAFFNSF